jgi:hypothetical protein
MREIAMLRAAKQDAIGPGMLPPAIRFGRLERAFTAAKASAWLRMYISRNRADAKHLCIRRWMRRRGSQSFQGVNCIVAAVCGHCLESGIVLNFAYYQ